MRRQREAMMDGGRCGADEQAREGAVARRPAPEHAQEERREQWRVHECEHELQEVHDVVETRGKIRGSALRPMPKIVAMRPIQR